ncbi:MAG: ABC transporter substrate-binding protein, partial [Bdellovibrionales bacterium]|nr:ABC transporter substrate-binding protein [Bdellovibrionales bacterium]
KYVFNHWVTPETEAALLAKEIKRRRYQRIAFINSEHEGIIAVFNAIRDKFKQEGLWDKVVLEEFYLADTTDCRTFLTKARAAQPDVMMVLLLSSGISTFAKQALESGIMAEIAGMELFEDEHVVQAANGALYGKWYVNSDEFDPEFIDLYRQRYKEFPGWASANAYDAVTLLAIGARKFGKNSEQIAKFLKELSDYKGAAGRYSATGDNRFTIPAAVKIIEKDGFKKIG